MLAGQGFKMNEGHCFRNDRLEKLNLDLWQYIVEPGIKVPSLKPAFMNQRVEAVNAGWLK